MTPAIDAARILEIGDTYYFKAQYPERTTLLWTAVRPTTDPRLIDSYATPARVRAELKAARDGRYDIVVAYPPRYSGAHPRYWGRALLRRPFSPWAALTRAFGVSLLRFARPGVPLVAIGMDDSFNLARPALFLLDKADVFIKRELPVDRWMALSGPVHTHIATFRYRRDPRWNARLARIEPIGLPQWMIDPALTHGPQPEKTADLFFSGAVEGNSTVRRDGLAELERLRQKGIVIDYPEKPLDHDAYQRRIASAWLAWSPAGRGWQCNRHYEAALVQTVPVINYPTVLRHAPLVEGVHAFHYAPEPGGLELTVLAALADKERLRRMAVAARDLAAANHTRKAWCDHILRRALGPVPVTP